MDKIEVQLQLKIAEEKYEKAELALKEFEEGEDDGKWLKDLRRKMRSEKLSENEMQERARLEIKEKELTMKLNNWEEYELYLRKELAYFNKERESAIITGKRMAEDEEVRKKVVLLDNKILMLENNIKKMKFTITTAGDVGKLIINIAEINQQFLYDFLNSNSKIRFDDLIIPNEFHQPCERKTEVQKRIHRPRTTLKIQLLRLMLQFSTAAIPCGHTLLHV
ncbi:3291_t:CDS:2 [Funneliformis geosporum]|uniref:3291_t:CDS:1 n=1 Tax=Funneliformis geosporum TaxID=1117311 RepID=A0A9W4WW92_9GLOM|nr:3291_t:CDS:2 [Funneliformis geosporum]